jgi:hypothetical protein
LISNATVVDAGLSFSGFAEGGAPVPTTLSFRATRGPVSS